MSTIFGVVRQSSGNVTDDDLREMALATASYAFDGVEVIAKGRIGMGSQPFHTHNRSKSTNMVQADPLGNVVALDGRIDNWSELASILSLAEQDVSDEQLVLAAYVRWGPECFAKLIGEWALALWSENSEVLYLARDHAGTRTLYYSCQSSCVRWSTFVDTLVRGSNASVSPDIEYLRRYITSIPSGSLTGYDTVRAVEPASYVAFGNSVRSERYWNASELEQLNYRSDSEYVEGLLSHLKVAVERRCPVGDPVIAQLSGGMDSSTIVCISDILRRSTDPSAPLLQTMSFIDDSEPSWNESPYIEEVESRRGQEGAHIPITLRNQTFDPPYGQSATYHFPGADSSSIAIERQVKSAIADRGYRAVLSGIGGDEILGGVPDPCPQLASSLLTGNLALLLKESFRWSMVQRVTLVHTIAHTARFAAQLYRRPSRTSSAPRIPWVKNQHPTANSLDEARLRGRRQRSPEAISNRLGWRQALETLPSTFPDYLARYEYRYPYLDRNLVEFAFRIPHARLIQPGRRRYLMRKAVTGIVPEKIVERKRKAFVVRSILLAIREGREAGRKAFTGPRLAALGLIDQRRFVDAVEFTTRGEDLSLLAAVIRTLNAEVWLEASIANFAST